MIENNISKMRFEIPGTPINLGIIRADMLDEESKKSIFSDILKFHDVDFYIIR